MAGRATARCGHAVRFPPIIPSLACSTGPGVSRPPATTSARRRRCGCGRRSFATSASTYCSTRCAATAPTGPGIDRPGVRAPVATSSCASRAVAGATSGRRPRLSPPSTGPAIRRAAATAGCTPIAGIRTSGRPSFTGAASGVSGSCRRPSTATPSLMRARTVTSLVCFTVT